MGSQIFTMDHLSINRLGLQPSWIHSQKLPASARIVVTDRSYAHLPMAVTAALSGRAANDVLMVCEIEQHASSKSASLASAQFVNFFL